VGCLSAHISLPTVTGSTWHIAAVVRSGQRIRLAAPESLPLPTLSHLVNNPTRIGSRPGCQISRVAGIQDFPRLRAISRGKKAIRVRNRTSRNSCGWTRSDHSPHLRTYFPEVLGYYSGRAVRESGIGCGRLAVASTGPILENGRYRHSSVADPDVSFCKPRC